MKDIIMSSICTVTLYHQDTRTPNAEEWLNKTEVSFSRQTATRANDVVSAYFGVTQEWDKKLLQIL